MWIGCFFICWVAYLWLEACRDDEEDSYYHNTNNCNNGAFEFDDIDSYDITNYNVDPTAALQHSIVFDDE